MNTSKNGVRHRLLIAHGQIQKVVEMIDSGAYCIDVIHQIQAVRSALKKAEHEILRNHLQTCVVEQIEKGESKKVVEEIMKVMEKND